MLDWGASLTQKLVASAVDDCIVHLSSSEEAGLNFDLSMTRLELTTKGVTRSDNQMVFEGRTRAQ